MLLSHDPFSSSKAHNIIMPDDFAAGFCWIGKKKIVIIISLWIWRFTDIEFNNMNTANLASSEEVNVFEQMGWGSIIKYNLYVQARYKLELQFSWTFWIDVFVSTCYMFYLALIWFLNNCATHKISDFLLIASLLRLIYHFLVAHVKSRFMLYLSSCISTRIISYLFISLLNWSFFFLSGSNYFSAAYVSSRWLIWFLSYSYHFSVAHMSLTFLSWSYHFSMTDILSQMLIFFSVACFLSQFLTSFLMSFLICLYHFSCTKWFLKCQSHFSVAHIMCRLFIPFACIVTYLLVLLFRCFHQLSFSFVRSQFFKVLLFVFLILSSSIVI